MRWAGPRTEPWHNVGSPMGIRVPQAGPFSTHMPRVSLRLLRGEPDEMAELQRVLESAPTYSQRVTGSPAGPADAQSTYSALPPGKSYDDKFVFGVDADGRMVGCIDLIRGYPLPATAHIGLLLIDEAMQGLGLGRAAFALLEAHVRAWHACRRLRIGVVAANSRVMPFWQKAGFVPTGEVKPYRYGAVVSAVLVLEKRLSRAA